MSYKIIDKWEKIPHFVLNNRDVLFNGIYIPKGSTKTHWFDYAKNEQSTKAWKKRIETSNNN